MSERQLPMSEGDENGTDRSPEVHQPPPWRLIGTLSVAAVVAGFAIVLVYQWAHPRIVAHREERLRAAVQEVLGQPESYRPMYVVDGRLLDSVPAGADSADARTVYAGFDGGRLAGFAVAGQKPGYQDVIRLIFGYDPAEDQVIGMTVLQSKETPGLGAKITSDSSFIGEFDGIVPPLEGVKEGGDGPGEVDMITGATISSEAVIDIINEQLDAVGSTLRKAAEAGVGAPGDGQPVTGGDGGGADTGAGGTR